MRIVQFAGLHAGTHWIRPDQVARVTAMPNIHGGTKATIYIVGEAAGVEVQGSVENVLSRLGLELDEAAQAGD